MDINKYILEKALANKSLCQPGAQGIIGADSIDDLLKMYVKDIDYCLEHDFPTNDDLVNIGGDHLADHGIYVDSINRFVDRPFLVLLGSTKAESIYTGYSVGQLFVKHGSEVNVKAKDHAYLIVDCFDNSTVNIHAEGSARILVNDYCSRSVNATGPGSIEIINKHKKTY